MPLTLEELTADWPTPAKDATMDDLLRMAMLLVVSMPPQQQAMLRDLLKRSSRRMTMVSFLHAPVSQIMLHQDAAASLRT